MCAKTFNPREETRQASTVQNHRYVQTKKRKQMMSSTHRLNRTEVINAPIALYVKHTK